MSVRKLETVKVEASAREIRGERPDESGLLRDPIVRAARGAEAEVVTPQRLSNPHPALDRTVARHNVGAVLAPDQTSDTAHLQLRAPAAFRRIRDAVISPDVKIKIDALGLDATSPMRTLVLAAAGATGSVSAADFAKAMSAPTAPSLLTSDGLQVMRTRLFAADRSGVLVTSLSPSEQMMARLMVGARATISSADISAYQDKLQAQWANGMTAIPNSQRVAVTRAQLAQLGGGTDVMLASGDGGETIFRQSFIASYNKERRVPNWSSFTMSAADLAIRQDISRVDAFRADPDLARELGARTIAQTADYDNSGQDQGHQADRDDGIDQKAQLDSFLLSNMTPQTPELNRQSWRTIEHGVQQLTAATGATAVVITGPLYVDANMKPLAEKDIKWIGPDKDNPAGTRRIAVPSHSYKTVLLTLPNGQQTMFAYVVPNLSTLPTRKNGIAALMQKSLVSVAQLEQITGYKFFAGMDPSVASRLKARSDGLQVAAAAIPKLGPVVPPSAPPPPALMQMAKMAAGKPPVAETATEALETIWPKSVPKPAWLTAKPPANN